MSSENTKITMFDIVEAFVKNAESELQDRWNAWEKNLSKNELYEVVGALLARQVSLACNLARAPQMWNGHVAPIILRAMADVFISLAWILEKPEERSQRFLSYGLGQQKLHIEHRKKQLEKDGKQPNDDPLIKIFEEWINSQRYTFLTEVDIGSWSGLNTRQMAEEAGCIAFYNYVYSPFSPVVHSMWNHIAIYNLKRCDNPLHRYHNIPDARLEQEPDIHNLYLAAKYLNKVFKKFDEKFGVEIGSPSAFKNLCSILFYDDDQTPTPSESVSQT